MITSTLQRSLSRQKLAPYRHLKSLQQFAVCAGVFAAVLLLWKVPSAVVNTKENEYSVVRKLVDSSSAAWRSNSGTQPARLDTLLPTGAKQLRLAASPAVWGRPVGAAIGTDANSVIGGGLVADFSTAAKSNYSVPRLFANLHAAVDENQSHTLDFSSSTTKEGGALAPGIQSLSGSDVVWVTFTDVRRHALIRAQRAWRKALGVRAVIVTNVGYPDTGQAEARHFLESWTFWPDMPEGWNATAKALSDHRAAMAPIIAHRILGNTYKWMLFGADDVVFFFGGFARILSGLSSDTAYAITEGSPKVNQTEASVIPNSMYCAACNTYATGPDNSSAAGGPMLEGCPCQPHQLCAHWAVHQPDIAREVCGDKGLPDSQRPPWVPAFSEAGTVLSVALLQGLDWDSYRDCLGSGSHPVNGVDGFLAQCLWSAGFWITRPSTALTAATENSVAPVRWQHDELRNMSQLATMLRQKGQSNPPSRFCSSQPPASDTNCTVPDEEDAILTTMATANAHHHPPTLHSVDRVAAYDIYDNNEKGALDIEAVIELYDIYIRKLYSIYHQD